MALAPLPLPLWSALPLSALNRLSLVAMRARASLSFTQRRHHTGPFRLQKSNKEVGLKTAQLLMGPAVPDNACLNQRRRGGKCVEDVFAEYATAEGQ